MNQFRLGVHTATFTRTGQATFEVRPAEGAGTHLLEILRVPDGDDFRLAAYLDGKPAVPFVGLFDLPTEVPLGGSLEIREGEF